MERFCIFLEWYNMLDYLHVIGFQILYVHAKTSLNSLNSFMNVALSARVQFFPRLRLSYVPRFIASYSKDELLILILVHLLNLFWRYNSFSSLIIFLGLPLLCSRFSSEAKAWRRASCCSSSITNPLKVSSEWRKFMIYSSSLNTVQFVILSEIDDL